MKKVLITLIGLGSFTAFAKCPDINGIFACTSLDKSGNGSIVKLVTNTTEDGRVELLLNNQVHMSEGKKGVFCNNNSIKDSGRSVLQLDNETLEFAYSWQAGKTSRTASSTCVRLR